MYTYHCGFQPGGGGGGEKEGCLTIPSTIPIFSWTLGYNCLPVIKLFIFPFRGRERGICASISPHHCHPFYPEILREGGSAPPPHQVQALVLRSQGGNRGLERLGGGTVVGQTAAARAKFSP